MADTLKRIFPEDYVARYGGDEFLVVMPERDLTYAMEHAELLCAGIRECKIPNEDSEVESWLTISVGGVCAIPKEPNRVWDFLSAADNTLYEQKKEQKGKFVLSGRGEIFIRNIYRNDQKEFNSNGE